MRRAIKQAVLHGSKRAGLFRTAERVTRDGLQILCYHGTALAQEHQFLPKLFMAPETFERRLRLLADGRYPVLALGEAVERLARGDLPARAVVITIDDGFYGTFRLAWPALRHYGFPATIYMTTYYCVKEHPIFGLVVEYMLWKTRATVLELDGLGTPLRGCAPLQDPAVRQRLGRAIGEHGETHCSEDERVAIARRLGDRLGVSYDELAASRMLNLMTVDELRELAAAGADVQAHTHRHRFPRRQSEAQRELDDNRGVLEPALGRRLEHFCYPSGEWHEEHWPWLAAAGMRTATTCEQGLNYPNTPRLALRRFLDGEHITDVEFEAEITGYAELLRRARAPLAGRRRRLAGAAMLIPDGPASPPVG
jgi:peptidoglycan/xylan/chitin deacetylase (PgdA/CDA1 family)